MNGSTSRGWETLGREGAATTRSRRRPLPFPPTTGVALETMFDSLADEILDRQDDHTRAFLLEVAILPRFTTPMAAALTGRPDTARLLARLQSRLGLVESDQHGGFQVPALLRASLLARGRSGPGRNQSLSRAAGLLVEAGQLAAACALLAEAEDWPGLSALAARSCLTVAPGPGEPPSIRVRAFGRLAIEVGGQPLRFGRKRPSVPLAVLALLVASDEPLEAGQTLAALWPGYHGCGPRGTLDTAVYRLRKLIGCEGAITCAEGRLALSDQHCRTDVRELAATCRQIGLAGEKPCTPRLLEGWERSLFQLYQGPFAAGDDLPPLVRARDRFRRLVDRAVADLGRLWRHLGHGERGDALVRRAGELVP